MVEGFDRFFNLRSSFFAAAFNRLRRCGVTLASRSGVFVAGGGGAVTGSVGERTGSGAAPGAGSTGAGLESGGVGSVGVKVKMLEASLFPAEFTARTSTEYVVPFVKPLIVADVPVVSSDVHPPAPSNRYS